MPTWGSFQPLVSCQTVVVRYPSTSDHISRKTAEGLTPQGICSQLFMSQSLPICRLSAHFWSEIWVLIGEWEQNGSRHAYWIMTQLQIMVIGHMEQVSYVFTCNPLNTKGHLHILVDWNWMKCFCCTLTGVGNDPREDRYFSIPKQVSIDTPD